MRNKPILNGISAIVLGVLFMFTPALALASSANEGVVKDKIDALEEVIEDSVITTKVKAEIFATKSLETLDIHVETIDGVVTLSGQVNDPADVELAGKVATSVNGVKKVVNELCVPK